MDRRTRATLLVLAAAALWGSSFVVIKLGILAGGPPVTLSLLRFVVATVVSLFVVKMAGPLKFAALKDPLVLAIGLTNAAGFVFQYL